jgi:hypothetical protein
MRACLILNDTKVPLNFMNYKFARNIFVLFKSILHIVMKKVKIKTDIEKSIYKRILHDKKDYI